MNRTAHHMFVHIVWLGLACNLLAGAAAHAAISGVNTPVTQTVLAHHRLDDPRG